MFATFCWITHSWAKNPSSSCILTRPLAHTAKRSLLARSIVKLARQIAHTVIAVANTLCHSQLSWCAKETGPSKRCFWWTARVDSTAPGTHTLHSALPHAIRDHAPVGPLRDPPRARCEEPLGRIQTQFQRTWAENGPSAKQARVVKPEHVGVCGGLGWSFCFGWEEIIEMSRIMRKNRTSVQCVGSKQNGFHHHFASFFLCSGVEESMCRFYTCTVRAFCCWEN